MATDKAKALEEYKNKIAELEAEIEAERIQKLATLHESVGLKRASALASPPQ